MDFRDGLDSNLWNLHAILITDSKCYAHGVIKLVMNVAGEVSFQL